MRLDPAGSSRLQRELEKTHEAGGPTRVMRRRWRGRSGLLQDGSRHYEGEAFSRRLTLFFNLESGCGVQLPVLLHLGKHGAQVVLPFEG